MSDRNVEEGSQGIGIGPVINLLNLEISAFLGCHINELPGKAESLPESTFRSDFVTRLIAGLQSEDDGIRGAAIRVIHCLMELVPQTSPLLIPLIWTPLMALLRDPDEGIRSHAFILTDFIVCAGILTWNPSINDLRELARAHRMNLLHGNFEQKGQAWNFFRHLLKMDRPSARVVAAEIVDSDILSDIIGMIDEAGFADQQ
jgi:hypothetical protein